MSQSISTKHAGEYSFQYIFFQRVIRYIQIGFLLHLMGITGVFLFFFFGRHALNKLEEGRIILFLLYTYIAGYGFTLPFFSQLDARSRYQNYKAVKDLLYIHGYQKRIIKPFLRSRCQRDAVKVAADDLQFHEKLKAYYYDEGYRWYHLLPDYVFKKPGVFLTKRYWTTTLLARRYKQKYFLW
jgi:hypothetical protein